MGGYNGLLGPLDQWKTGIDQIAFTSMSSTSTPSQFAINVTRLDCAWPYCFGPNTGAGGYLIDGGDFCAPDDPQNINTSFPHNTRLNESYVLATAHTCSYETATQHVDDLGRGVLGSIIVMRENEPTLLEINSDGAVPLNHGTAVTSVSYQVLAHANTPNLIILPLAHPHNTPLFHTMMYPLSHAQNIHLIIHCLTHPLDLPTLSQDGMALKDKLHTLQQTGNKGEISFFSKIISGYFIVVDGKKRLQEIGSHGEASLMLASWAMQYENYRCEVFARLAKPAYVIPIISEKVSYWFPTTTGQVFAASCGLLLFLYNECPMNTPRFKKRSQSALLPHPSTTHPLTTPFYNPSSQPILSPHPSTTHPLTTPFCNPS